MIFNPQPKQCNKKSKKLTDASQGNNCIRCQAPNAYACHYNGYRQHAYGKGRGIKCSDAATADFCQQCDQVYTEGSRLGFNGQRDRSERFLHWVMMTNIRRFNNEVLKA